MLDKCNCLIPENQVEYVDRRQGPSIIFKAKFGDNEVWEIDMCDGNRFRYSHGKMIPFSQNSKEHVLFGRIRENKC